MHKTELLPVDDAYLAKRNVPGRKTLAGKRIVLVGCGTIGGFLTELLLKAGAGTEDGELVLVDPQLMVAGNVGRHRLGFNSIHQYKAVALVGEMERLAPGAAMKALPVNVQEAKLETFDLLIDATGDETLSHWMASTYLELAPQLAVWVEGPGTAVRSLLTTSARQGCRRCFCDYRMAGAYKSTNEELPLTQAGHGCEHLYVPFPATVSIQAACLAAEAAVDWANGITTPNLRTRVTDSKYSLATPDCELPQREKCPACVR